VEEILIEIAAIANDILSQVANVRHLSIAFETEREAVTTGNTVAKITPVIYSRGRKVSLSSGVSGGMRTSIELATDLAVGQVISRRRGSFPGFMILDEAFDGLGGAAKESCLEMLKTCANDRLILVVDHDAQFQGLFDQTITVNMVDGRSTLEYNS
jgi:DNA repair exonuclease SbcCD ATPase subunit